MNESIKQLSAEDPIPTLHGDATDLALPYEDGPEDLLLNDIAGDMTAMRRDLGILNEDELAQALDITTATLATWRGAGSGPKYTKLGKSVFYRLENLKDWISENVVAPQPK